ncbi:unnamed protein product [Nesidiocoris tenuis]|uniref:Small ribosomal subunit protein mS35 mitochondrial conserved domain-containing protein n=1 Tax=Nesidiocoris tenuis TaxID=355587 RepID=A0A6H5GQ78_9HEMI|nr:unnamed protein product [Nesidiocoris tenuis]
MLFFEIFDFSPSRKLGCNCAAAIHSDLKLDQHAKDKFLRLVGERYDEKTDTVTIVTDKCPRRKQNYDYAIYLLTALYHESWGPGNMLLIEKDSADYSPWARPDGGKYGLGTTGRKRPEIYLSATGQALFPLNTCVFGVSRIPILLLRCRDSRRRAKRAMFRLKICFVFFKRGDPLSRYARVDSIFDAGIVHGLTLMRTSQKRRRRGMRKRKLELKFTFKFYFGAEQSEPENLRNSNEFRKVQSVGQCNWLVITQLLDLANSTLAPLVKINYCISDEHVEHPVC